MWMGAQVSPPPHGDIDVWTRKAYSVLPSAYRQSGGGGVVRCQVPNPTTTRWWWPPEARGVLFLMFHQWFRTRGPGVLYFLYASKSQSYLADFSSPLDRSSSLHFAGCLKCVGLNVLKMGNTIDLYKQPAIMLSEVQVEETIRSPILSITVKIVGRIIYC